MSMTGTNLEYGTTSVHGILWGRRDFELAFAVAEGYDGYWFDCRKTMQVAGRQLWGLFPSRQESDAVHHHLTPNLIRHLTSLSVPHFHPNRPTLISEMGRDKY
ncbi:hypothetical protein ACLOJK_025040 [Asimina triloba]